jgi:hypothetical protein
VMTGIEKSYMEIDIDISLKSLTNRGDTVTKTRSIE